MHEGKLLSLRELDNLKLPKLEAYLSESLFLPGTINQIVGTDGVGKSFLSFDLGVHFVTGKAFGPFMLRQTNCLYVSEEMSLQELQQRGKLLLRSFDFEDAADGLFVTAKSGLNLSWASERAKLKDMIDESQAGVVFLDPISELHTAPENNHDQIRAMTKGLRDEVAVPLGIAIVMVHHMGKESEYRSGKERSRGTYNQACSDIFTLDQDKENDRVIVSFPKVRHGKPPAPLAFRIVDTEGRITIEVEYAGVSGLDTPGVGISHVLDAIGSNEGLLSKKLLVGICKEKHGWGASRTEAAIRACLDAQLIKRTKNGNQVIYLDSRMTPPETNVVSFPQP